MSDKANLSQHIVPAHLGFLAIYNPSLGTTDETVENQIVYYCSYDRGDQPSESDTLDPKSVQDALREQRNEQLRQIGLAQGMVEFGRSFSDGKAVDTVETAKSRIILHELEPGWWILAVWLPLPLPGTSLTTIQSINLTILSGMLKTSATKGAIPEEPRKLEYSSREVKPAALLLSDLLRAHSIFLLHHTSSLSTLFGQTKRSKFFGVLGRYWDTFLSTWNVLMHGNPGNDLFRGIKIAACGELGVGVGEEERGSGEREVLEGFVGRIDGLVDVIVSKFGVGDSPGESEKLAPEKGQPRAKPTEPWLGSSDDPAVEDGAIFLGTGALSRKSLRDISHWVEDLYRWGSLAYGVVDNPTSTRRTRESKAKVRAMQAELSPPIQHSARQGSGVTSGKESRELSPGPMNTIPPTPIDEQDPANKQASIDQGQLNNTSADVDSMGNKFVQYLKLGYGTHWSVGGTSSKGEGHGEAQTGESSASTEENAGRRPVVSDSAHTGSPVPSSTGVVDDSRGHYLIGLLGDLEDDDDDHQFVLDDNSHSPRLLLRTLTVALEHGDNSQPGTNTSVGLSNGSKDGAPSKTMETPDRNPIKKLRAVVYVNKPFIFVLLFNLETKALALSSLYRSLHHQIGPLIKPLLTSTSFRASKPDIGANGRGDSVTPIYDLVWDPKLLTVTSTIPNIPDPYRAHSKSRRLLPWSRIEALNTHMQIVNTRVTEEEGLEKERTCKTSRGWWVVWTRVPEIESKADLRSSRGTSRRTSTSELGQPSLEESGPTSKEIFLIRRASDNVGGKLTSRLVSGASGGGDAGWMSGTGRLAQGIGVDTKRYIESLLNLNS